MTENVVDAFQQEEAKRTAAALRYHRWSMVPLAAMIAEYEEKLLASDLPVEDDDGQRPFWESM